MSKALEKVPIWAYTLVLMAACCLSAVFTANIYKGLMDSYGLYFAGSLVFYVIVIGVLGGAILRLLARVTYSLGDRIFFSLMRAVPDYNLRRLPISYNDYVRITLFWLIIAKVVEALCMSLLVYVLPVAYYLWRFISSLALAACLFAAYFVMDKRFVPTWQSGKCFLSLAIPSVVFFVLSMVL